MGLRDLGTSLFPPSPQWGFQPCRGVGDFPLAHLLPQSPPLLYRSGLWLCPSPEGLII